MRLSCATSVFVHYDLVDAVKAIAAAGYQGIDIWCGRPHVYRNDYTAKELAALRELVLDSGLNVASLMPAFYRYPHSLSSPRDVVRTDSIDYMQRCIDNAVALGAGMVLVVPALGIRGQSRADAWSRFADSVNQVATYADQNDMLLGLEVVNPTAGALINTTDDALKLVSELGCKSLGIVLDTGHLHLTGESAQDALSKAGQLLREFHLNDNDGQRQQNHVPGEGNFDFGSFVDAVDAAGFEGYLPVELGYDYAMDPIPAVHRAASYMRGVLERRTPDASGIQKE